jgi:hypothetical protein
MCRCELRGEEALGHVVMEANAHLSSRAVMLGRPFANATDYSALASKDFSRLPSCRAGSPKIRACDSDPFPLNDVVVWNGRGEHWNTERFLLDAPKMMQHIPDNIGISWTRTHAWLCILPPGYEGRRGGVYV